MGALRGIVYLNGRLLAASKARISVFDRGLLYGDGLVDTMRTYGGEPFAIEDHLERLARSCEIFGLRLPRLDWAGCIRTLVRRNGLHTKDAAVRLTITRGAAEPGLVPPPGLTPTVLMSAAPINPAIRRQQQRGAIAVLLPFAREGFFAEHKTVDYLPGVLGRIIASRHRAAEGLYVSARGVVTEGTTSNVFVVKRGKILTPPTDGILPGVTRAHVVAVARNHRLPIEERPITPRLLGTADEVFLTSAVVEVMPVVRLGERPVGTGRVGPVTRRVQHLFRAHLREHLRRKR